MSSTHRNALLGKLRLVALFGILIAMFVASRPTAFGIGLALPWILAGEGLRCWAAGHLTKTVELVVSGPYRYTRNPLYLGRLLIGVGIACLTPLPFYLHWVLLALGLMLFFGYYLPRKERVEPARLEESHGEAYRQYRERIPALWPTFAPYPPSERRWHLDRFMKNREHLMVLGLGAIIAAQMTRALT